MTGDDATSKSGAVEFGGFGLESLLRRLSLRSRILSLAAINTAVVLMLTLLIIDGANVLKSAWTELLRVRTSDRTLSTIESESGRLQSLIHRYFTQPNPEVLAEIEKRRGTLASEIAETGNLEPSLATAARSLGANTEKLIKAFDDLRQVRATISSIYEGEVLKSAREASGLYAIVESTLRQSDGLVRPSLEKSRETFSQAIVAANAYYLSLAPNSVQQAFAGLDTIEQTLPIMLDLSDSDLQRAALNALRSRVVALRESLQKLTGVYDMQSVLLRDFVDRSQSDMTATMSTLAETIRGRQQEVQEHLDATLNAVYSKIAVIAVAFLVVIALFGTAIARTVSTPLTALMNAMNAIVGGKLDERVEGVAASDEIGAMARAIEVFRTNAIAKLRADDELRASKERAEKALDELRDAQLNLIEAEKLAALGGLVAGVAHEVNNPVGIGLTVASSLSRRCETFAREIDSGDLRRSRLVEFVNDSREASTQLVANLLRAADLIQSFKQVAVDRSHAERRAFDLREATEQIVASLRPGLSKKHLSLALECPAGIAMDSFPGPYGQVLTNLFLNSVTHGFGKGQSGEIKIRVAREGPDSALVEFSDNGEGMSEDVRRKAFEPFFTTLRGQGGTGLGLHIVYNIVTQKLGGRIAVSSQPGRGTLFRVVLPLAAPGEAAGAMVAAAGSRG